MQLHTSKDNLQLSFGEEQSDFYGKYVTEVYFRPNAKAACAEFGDVENMFLVLRHLADTRCKGKVEELLTEMQTYIDTNVQYAA